MLPDCQAEFPDALMPDGAFLLQEGEAADWLPCCSVNRINRKSYDIT